MVPWLIMGWTFLPRFFADYRHFTHEQSGTLLAVLGLGSALSSFTVPAISDRVGRKPAMIFFCLLGLATPLAALYWHGSLVVLGLLMFLGWLGCGTFPLFMGVIPGETISRRYAATAMGLIVCVGEFIGGTGINAVSGPLADHTSITTPIFIEAGCALIGGLLCTLLIETAPIKRRSADARPLGSLEIRERA
jgi:MFS family permease